MLLFCLFVDRCKICFVSLHLCLLCQIIEDQYDIDEEEYEEERTIDYLRK